VALFLRRGTRLLAVAAIALSLAVLLHTAGEAAAGHHEHAAHGAIAVCVLLFTLAVSAGIAAPPSVMISVGTPIRLRPSRVLLDPLDSRSRASPAWLQRFLR
jgi:hypothetical protein